MRSLVLVEGVKRERVNESIPCFKMWISAINSIRQEDEMQTDVSRDQEGAQCEQVRGQGRSPRGP